MTMRRRTGWFTVCSASDVVYPTPVKAERAWKRALAFESPEVEVYCAHDQWLTVDPAEGSRSP